MTPLPPGNYNDAADASLDHKRELVRNLQRYSAALGGTILGMEQLLSEGRRREALAVFLFGFTETFIDQPQGLIFSQRDLAGMEAMMLHAEELPVGLVYLGQLPALLRGYLDDGGPGIENALSDLKKSYEANLLWLPRREAALESRAS